jgi:hypothetical protein
LLVYLDDGRKSIVVDDINIVDANAEGNENFVSKRWQVLLHADLEHR